MQKMPTSDILRIFKDEEGNISCEFGDVSEMGMEFIGLLESIKMRVFLNDDTQYQAEEQNS